MATNWFTMLVRILLLFGTQAASGLELDVDNAASIQQAASKVANGMMHYYKGNQSGQIPGILVEPYFWWEAGAMFGALIDYWRYTGDSTYNDMTTKAMLWQASLTRDFMPPNQSKSEGNDDQAFWGITALMAAESGFPDPPPEEPQWLALAQAVFNQQAGRWDDTTCGGGLRWQISSLNRGWNYKNSISQGCFFDMATRLGAFTKNQTYYDWADKMYDWCESVGLISPTYQVFDGTDALLKCTELNHIQWSYNTGIFLHGAAVMWNQTTGPTQEVWRNRTEGDIFYCKDPYKPTETNKIQKGLLKSSLIFFTGKNKTIMFEVGCERNPPDSEGRCNVDQRSFKAYLSRWLAATSILAPWTSEMITPLLRDSALAAAQSCSGGTDGVTCGLKWWVEGWDGDYGVGEQMSALEVIQSNLISRVKGPLSDADGGTSKGDAGAGGGETGIPEGYRGDDLSAKDRKGAAALTVVLVLATLGAAWWISV